MSDDRARTIHDLIPPDWDQGPLSLAHELRQMLAGIVDAGTGIDSGGGDGTADLFPTVGGVEYHIAITAPGRFTSDTGGFLGFHLREAIKHNECLIKALENAQAALGEGAWVSASDYIWDALKGRR